MTMLYASVMPMEVWVVSSGGSGVISGGTLRLMKRDNLPRHND